MNNETAAEEQYEDQDQQTQTIALNLPEELIDSLRPKIGVDVLRDFSGSTIRNDDVEHDLTTLKDARRRLIDGSQDINEAI